MESVFEALHAMSTALVAYNMIILGSEGKLAEAEKVLKARSITCIQDAFLNPTQPTIDGESVPTAEPSDWLYDYD